MSAAAGGSGGSSRVKGESWALVAALSYALNNVFTGVAVQGNDLNYLVGVTLRATPTLVFAAAVGWGARRRNPQALSPLSDWRALAALIGYGLLTFVIGGPLYFGALREGGVVVASPITGTQVLWGALIAALFLREPFTWRMAAGMLVSVSGIALLSLGKSGGLELSQGWWLAIPAAAGAALCWSLSGVLIAYTMRRGVDRFQALSIAVLVGLVGVNACLLVGGDLGAYAATRSELALSVFTAGLFGTVALVSMTSALAFTSVASANAINSLQVGLAPLMAWLFVGEGMNAPMSVGILLIMVGVVVVQRARLACEEAAAEEPQAG